MQVVREFKMPEDRTAEEVDAGSDGDVLVMLELVQDQVRTALQLCADGAVMYGT